ncbi:hypothetical protein VTN00DRAFT_1587 [Thermoascus crustaceus]|uniref:uncharacterized protein n=1 Tax=Thermoascus crustaceus TaxID=5088 RepID=UPI00374353F7
MLACHLPPHTAREAIVRQLSVPLSTRPRLTKAEKTCDARSCGQQMTVLPKTSACDQDVELRATARVDPDLSIIRCRLAGRGIFPIDNLGPRRRYPLRRPSPLLLTHAGSADHRLEWENILPTPIAAPRPRGGGPCLHDGCIPGAATITKCMHRFAARHWHAHASRGLERNYVPLQVTSPSILGLPACFYPPLGRSSRTSTTFTLPLWLSVSGPAVPGVLSVPAGCPCPDPSPLSRFWDPVRATGRRCMPSIRCNSPPTKAHSSPRFRVTGHSGDGSYIINVARRFLYLRGTPVPDLPVQYVLGVSLVPEVDARPERQSRYLQVDLHVGVVTNAQVQSSPLAGPRHGQPGDLQAVYAESITSERGHLFAIVKAAQPGCSIAAPLAQDVKGTGPGQASRAHSSEQAPLGCNHQGSWSDKRPPSTEQRLKIALPDQPATQARRANAALGLAFLINKPAPASVSVQNPWVLQQSPLPTAFQVNPYAVTLVDNRSLNRPSIVVSPQTFVVLVHCCPATHYCDSPLQKAPSVSPVRRSSVVPA